MGRHRPGFPRVLPCTLVRLGYDGSIPVYHCRSFQAHGLMCCVVRVEIPVNPMAPWTGAVVGGDWDDAVENMAHVALTAMCEQRLADTTNTPIALFPIQDQEDWRSSSGISAWMQLVTSPVGSSMPGVHRWRSMPSTCSTFSTTPAVL
jgi:hypothetical protein